MTTKNNSVFVEGNPLSKLIYIDNAGDPRKGKYPWRLADNAELMLQGMSDPDLHLVFVQAELQLGNQFVCMIDHSRNPFAGDSLLVLETRCSGVNHAIRVEALHSLHQLAEEILCDRGLDPYEHVQVKSELKA
jgi:hypothetical protein